MKAGIIKQVLDRLGDLQDLMPDQTHHAMKAMLSGATTDDENFEVLRLLSQKGETDGELSGMLDAMQEAAIITGCKDDAIDMCGTGGDGMRTFNVSTAASFVVAAAGGRVAKHGNRSSSGKVGSADIFECLGCDIRAEPAVTAAMLARHGICFMFAQKYHPAMRHVASARKRLAVRTAFNLLGPLANPAGVARQMIGVSSPDMLERIPRLLGRRGARTIMTVHSDNGIDEFTTSAPNRVVLFKDGEISHQTVMPADVGLHASALQDIQVNGRQESLSAFVGSLSGTADPAMIETCALNAAGGLVVAGICDDIVQGTRLALDAIYDGSAMQKLKSYVSDAGNLAMLDEIADG